MGCFQSKTDDQESTKKEAERDAPKQYSWDKREKVDPKDFTIENLKGETAGRIPGTINGQQFIIQNCEDCNIYLFDHSATISIDDCVNCRIFLGPVKTSVFVRDCKECKLMVACQQFRTRDCKRLDVFLSCVTQPIIESSSSMKFGCFQYYYPELEEQFQGAGLSVYNNNWSNIHDFTPLPEESNYSLLPQEVKVEDFLPLPDTEQFSNVQISLEADRSLVPATLGTRRKPSDESCLAVFFNDGGSHDRAVRFIQEMKDHHSQCVLVQSKEITMQAADAERVFASDRYAMAVQQGPVIAFEYNGEDCCKACQDTLVTVSKGSTGLVFVSSTSSSAVEQIENFYNFADMQMNA